LQVLSALQIHDWDAFTIKHEPVLGEALMERAALKAALVITRRLSRKRPVLVFCGPGNNGADGLVVARWLNAWSYTATAIAITGGLKESPLFKLQRTKLLASSKSAYQDDLTEDGWFRSIPDNALIVDALFGTSVRLPLPGVFTKLIVEINVWKESQLRFPRERVIAVDIPSGLHPDFGPPVLEQPVIQADLTITFQCLKPSFLLADTGSACGFVEIEDIGLHRGYLKTVKASNFLLDLDKCRSLFRIRPPFGHKGTFGHSLLIAGSRQKAGAAVLCAKGSLHGGSGLVSVCVPESIREILLSQVPECMAFLSANPDFLAGDPIPSVKFNALGIGPGLGMHPETVNTVNQVFEHCTQPVVIDADALNILAGNRNWPKKVPHNAILTPHPGEFDRLAGPSGSDHERLSKQVILSRESGAVIILKGNRTSITFPDGKTWFNTSGNPGMATGGSGDTLTGILTALLAQGYPPTEAALIGVHLHGLAGDLAALDHGETALSAGMLSAYLGKAFLKLEL